MKSLASLLRIVTMALLLAAPLAHADDDSLPPPTNGTEEEVPFNPPPQSDADESLLDPGSDALPAPMGSEGSSDNVVNSQSPEDDIFLPTPQAASDGSSIPLATAPVGASSSYEEDADWRYGWNKRPVFSLHGGVGIFNYPVKDLKENIPGGTFGASARVWSLGQTVFLHAYASFSWVKIGGVGPFSDVKDAVLHFGPILEVGIGRRLSIYGSFMRRNHTFSSGPDVSLQYNNINNYTTVAEDSWQPGVGIQYDFYVVPHGSLGIRAHVEQDMTLVALTMSVEPAPRKKLSLNFKDEP